MCCNSKGCGKGGCKCMTSKIGWTLMAVGGLNWGLVGVGMLLGSNLNVVNLLLGSMPTVEAIVYVLVGVATIMSMCGCKCKKCSGGSCGACKDGVCDVHGKMDNSMPSNPQ